MKYHINKVPRRDGDISYYIATAVRNGNRVSKKNVKSLGTRQSLINNGVEDIDSYLKDILNEYNNELEESISLSFNPNKQIISDTTGYVEAGSLFVKRVFDDIKLGEALDKISDNYKIKYSLSETILFHIANRMIHPDSKIEMYKHALDHSLLKPVFYKDSLYRAMDILFENKNEILRSCYNNLPYKVKRDRRILYYDCTNTYFESEIEEGLRARGKGKRNEVEPLVSLGLVMDASGIPLTYTVFKGSSNEQKTLIPLEQEIIDEFRNSRFVMITDAGLSSKDNRCFNGIGNRKYITTLPVRMMSEEKLTNYIFDEKKEWITPNSEYKTPKDIKDKYVLLMQELTEAASENNYSKVDKINKLIYELSSIILYRRYPVKVDKKPIKYLEKKEDKNNPDKCFIEEDYLISYSLKYELRQKRQRDRLVAKAKSLLSNPGKLTHHGVNDPKQYIIKIEYQKDNGEIITDSEYEISKEVIQKQERLDGYYCVATNLLDDDNETIINAMKYRWFIEDSFRIMKQQFNFRPVGHHKDSRITSHFSLCFLTLLIYRYIQKMCHESKYESLKYITDEKLLESLRSYNLAIVKKDYYVPSFNLTPEIEELEKLFNIFLSREIMTPSIINKEIKRQLRDKR